MGRRASPPELKNGQYYAWHPGLKRKIGLGTSDPEHAAKLQRAFYGVQEMKPVEVAERIVVNLDNENDNETAKSLLDAWSKSNGGKTVDTPVSPPTNDVPSTAGPIPESSASNVAGNAVKAPVSKVSKGLTPEQTAILADGLRGVVTYLNTVIMGAAVGVFRTEIEKPDEETMKLLRMGWDLWLDQLFKKKDVPPWLIVLGANLIMAIGMWASGKPRPKKIMPKVPAAAELPSGITPLRAPPRPETPKQ